MKFKKCPVCKSPVPKGAKSCPICVKTFSKLQLFRMYWLKRTIWLLIAVIFFYNAAVIIVENKKIRRYLENPPETIDEIIQLEEEYEQLNFIQKYFVHKSEIDYLKKSAQMQTEREMVEDETITVYFQEGSVMGKYTGEITDNMPNGSGTFTFSDKNGEECVYEGSLSEGRIDGNGVMRFENGKEYVGDFKNGELNGYAEIYNEYGNIIAKGQFVNSELYGKGVIYDGNGSEIYSGSFKGDIPERFEYMEACEKNDIVNIRRNEDNFSNKNVCVRGVISDVISDSGEVGYKVYDLHSNVSIMVNGRENMKIYAVNDKVCIYGYCSTIDEELNSCTVYINSFYIEDEDDIINQ